MTQQTIPLDEPVDPRVEAAAEALYRADWAGIPEQYERIAWGTRLGEMWAPEYRRLARLALQAAEEVTDAAA